MDVNEKGRCTKCNLIPRPDIARARGEKHCRCDAEFNRIYDGMQGFLRQNDENIKTLAEKLVPQPTQEKKD